MIPSRISIDNNYKIEECRLLGCYAVFLLQEPTFWRNLAPPLSGWQESVNLEQRWPN
jgi:hypothetical protein